MWIHRKLITIFYRPLFIANLAVNAIAILFIRIFGWHFALNTLFIKAAGYAILIGYQSMFYSQTYFYYRNAGVTIRKMYTYTFCWDFLMFIVVTCLYFLTR